MQRLINSPFVERLRQKPKAVRVELAFVAALATTGVVGLLWGATLPFRLDTLPAQDEQELAEDSRSLGSFFSSARANMAQLIGAEGEPVEEESTGSVSGTYRPGAPAEYRPESRTSAEPAAVPIDRREVLIGTTTRSR